MSCLPADVAPNRAKTPFGRARPRRATTDPTQRRTPARLTAWCPSGSPRSRPAPETCWGTAHSPPVFVHERGARRHRGAPGRGGSRAHRGEGGYRGASHEGPLCQAHQVGAALRRLSPRSRPALRPYRAAGARTHCSVMSASPSGALGTLRLTGARASAEDHVFHVDRDAASVSSTIQTMLSGAGGPEAGWLSRRARRGPRSGRPGRQGSARASRLPRPRAQATLRRPAARSASQRFPHLSWRR